MTGVIDVLNKLWIQLSLVPSWDTREEIDLINVAKDINQNVTCNPTTLRDEGETIHNFAIVLACWPSWIILSFSKIDVHIGVTVRSTPVLHVAGTSLCLP